MPARQFAGVAVDDQRQRGPAVLSCPDPIHVRRPALIRPGRDRRDCLDPRTHADRTFANLPSLELKYPLDRVLVEPQEPGHGPATERRFLLDHRLDGLGKARINLRKGFGGPVINRPARHAKPGAKPGQRNLDAFSEKALLDALDHLSSAASSRAWYSFSRAQLQHGLTIGLLQILQLLRVLLANVERFGAQGIFHPSFGVVDPALSEGDRSNDRMASATVV